MLAILLPVVRYLGFGGVVAVGMLVFYEGVPLGPLRYVPWLGPQLEQLVDGRVDRAYRDGFAEADLVCREKQRIAEEKYLADLKIKQDALDAIVLDYINGRAENDSLQLALEEAVAAAEKEELDAPAATPRSCIPHGVSKQLNAIGR